MAGFCTCIAFMGTGAAFVVSGVSEKFSSLLFRFPRKIFILCISNKQRGREHWAVYFTNPQCFIITFYYSLA